MRSLRREWRKYLRRGAGPSKTWVEKPRPALPYKGQGHMGADELVQWLVLPCKVDGAWLFKRGRCSSVKTLNHYAMPLKLI